MKAATAIVTPLFDGRNILAPPEAEISPPAIFAAPDKNVWRDGIGEQVAEWRWRCGIIAPALAFPPKSRARAAALAQIAASPQPGFAGGIPKPISLRTLRRWCKAIGAITNAPQVRKARSDMHRRRCFVSRQWGQSAPLTDDEKARITASIDEYVTALWSGGAASARQVAQLATSKLLELSRAAGWKAATLKVCAVTRHAVEKHRAASLSAIHAKDAKLFSDKYQPRIIRHRDGLMPLDIVVGDVHPLDVIVTRADGTQATPRVIAWLDLANNRVHTTVHLYEKGRNVRQSDIAAAFTDLCEEWGIPRRLYLDNGSEYKWQDMMDGFNTITGLMNAHCALLAALATGGEIAQTLAETQESSVTRAKPYNAAAKPIEGMFGILEQRYFRHIPGWIAGDRMNKKTANVGKAPAAYGGSWRDFVRDFAACMDLYHATPQRGSLGGKSPNEAYAIAIDAGWERYTAKRAVFIFAFSETSSHQVRPQGIKIGGDWFYDDALIPLIGTRVQCRHAKWDASVILMLSEDGTAPIAIRRAASFAFTDTAGAKEQGRRAKISRGNVRVIADNVKPVDMMDEIHRHNATTSAESPPPLAPVAIELQLMGSGARAVEAIEAAKALPALPHRKLPAGSFLDQSTGEIVNPVTPAAPPPAPRFDFHAPPPTRTKPGASGNAPGFDLYAELAKKPPLNHQAKETETP